MAWILCGLKSLPQEHSLVSISLLSETLSTVFKTFHDRFPCPITLTLIIQSYAGLHSPNTLGTFTLEYWLLGSRDTKSIRIWFLPKKHLLASRSSLLRKHSACNRVGVTYMCTFQVVEMNWAELKYVEENCGRKGTLCSLPSWHHLQIQLKGLCVYQKLIEVPWWIPEEFT